MTNQELQSAIDIASEATKKFTDNEKSRTLWIDHLRDLLAIQVARAAIEDVPAHEKQ